MKYQGKWRQCYRHVILILWIVRWETNVVDDQRKYQRTENRKEWTVLIFEHVQQIDAVHTVM